MSRIVFMVEGGPELGMGHIIHSLALAEELKDKAEVMLLTNSEKVAAPWILADYICQYPKAGRAKAMLKALMPHVVIFDTLYPDLKAMQYAKEMLGAKIAVCNCMAYAAELLADLVVAGDAHGLENRRDRKMIYDWVTPRQHPDHTALWLTGPRYWVLRREFEVEPKQPKTKVERILLSFGGGSNDLDLDIPGLLQAYDVVTTHGLELSASDMAGALQRADLVICFPGLTPFESLRVGTPVIIIPKNEDQRRLCATLPLLEKEGIARLPGMIQGGEFIRPTDSVVKRMQIGQGKWEVVQAIEAWL